MDYLFDFGDITYNWEEDRARNWNITRTPKKGVSETVPSVVVAKRQTAHGMKSLTVWIGGTDIKQ